MRALIQRAYDASVTVDGAITGAITRGFVVLLGVGRDDTEREVTYLADRIAGLRVFRDTEGRMNRSITDAGGSILLVSQFTLYADVFRGRRPGFEKAAPPEVARALYEQMIVALSQYVPVETGVFGADMKVTLTNDGPVSIWIDTAERTTSTKKA